MHFLVQIKTICWVLIGLIAVFMCQDENKNEDENQGFGSFWNLCVTDESIFQCIIVLRAWFVRHRFYPEQTKTFVFIWVRFHFRPGTRTAYYYNEEQRDLTALPQESKEGIPWTWSSHYQGSCLAVNSPFGNYNRFFNQISYSLEFFKSHPICLLTYVCVFEKVFKFLLFLICAFWCE